MRSPWRARLVTHKLFVKPFPHVDPQSSAAANAAAAAVTFLADRWHRFKWNVTSELQLWNEYWLMESGQVLHISDSVCPSLLHIYHTCPRLSTNPSHTGSWRWSRSSWLLLHYLWSPAWCGNLSWIQFFPVITLWYRMCCFLYFGCCAEELVSLLVCSCSQNLPLPSLLWIPKPSQYLSCSQLCPTGRFKRLKVHYFTRKRSLFCLFEQRGCISLCTVVFMHVCLSESVWTRPRRMLADSSHLSWPLSMPSPECTLLPSGTSVLGSQRLINHYTVYH